METSGTSSPKLAVHVPDFSRRFHCFVRQFRQDLPEGKHPQFDLPRPPTRVLGSLVSGCHFSISGSISGSIYGSVCDLDCGSDAGSSCLVSISGSGTLFYVCVSCSLAFTSCYRFFRFFYFSDCASYLVSIS